MRDFDELRKRAAECLQLAERARTPQQKMLLLDLAAKWIELADQTAHVDTLLERDGVGSPGASERARHARASRRRSAGG